VAFAFAGLFLGIALIVVASFINSAAGQDAEVTNLGDQPAGDGGLEGARVSEGDGRPAQAYLPA
jgi:hypothetical protein